MPPRAGATAIQSAGDSPQAIACLLRQERVGGRFWAGPGELPAMAELLLVPDDAGQLAEMLDEAASLGLKPLALLSSVDAGPKGCDFAGADIDPWTAVERSERIWCGAGQELALVAAIAGKPPRIFGHGRFSACGEQGEALDALLVRELLPEGGYACPFTGAPIGPGDWVSQLAQWKALVESNRGNVAILGIARWKRVTVGAMLWDGTGPVRYADRAARRAPPSAGRVVAWKTRTRPSVLARLAEAGAEVAEIEDGMVRSSGLGANCVPPLSIVVDGRGIYFDPSRPSDLEHILQSAEMPQALIERAARLRNALVAGGIGKYGRDEAAPGPIAESGRRRMLVAGQVEDDRSILCGGAGLTNLDLLKAARAIEPDAWISYKPHPDVVAGHRKGHIAEAEVRKFADELASDGSPNQWIAQADVVHVITSLTGFEALLRGKDVVTHGVPFFAGWGLTRDLGPVPARRTRRRSLDELVAATLLLYPRYVDPVTRLPCPVEVVVERIERGMARVITPAILAREWQGRLKRVVQRLAGGR